MAAAMTAVASVVPARADEPQTAVILSDRARPDRHVGLASSAQRAVAGMLDSAMVGVATLWWTTGPGEFEHFGLSFVAIHAAYQVVGWSYGQTLGKAMMGLRVVDAMTGKRPGFRSALLRTLAAPVELLPPATFGLLRSLWDRNRQTWHDRFARTLVLYEERMFVPESAPSAGAQR
jgi:uncharacterized RDD family membrane protein YckC